jgi:hypothetical protein
MAIRGVRLVFFCGRRLNLSNIQYSTNQSGSEHSHEPVNFGWNNTRTNQRLALNIL